MSNQSVIPGDIDALSRQFDEGRHLRLGGWLVLLGFGGFLLWGLLAPLDKGVPVSGSVVVAGNRKAVQHPSGGVVSQIQVHEGDRVSAGQVLLLMDTVDSRTQRDALRSQQLSNAAQRARLQAERDGLQAIAFPALLQARRCRASWRRSRRASPDRRRCWKGSGSLTPASSGKRPCCRSS
nr:biotin/lipoyl-binding protein [Serratia marcescens]